MQKKTLIKYFSFLMISFFMKNSYLTKISTIKAHYELKLCYFSEKNGKSSRLNHIQSL